MEPEVARYFELVESRLSALQSLAQDLQESHSAFAEMDLDGILQHTSHQEKFCTRLRTVNHTLRAAERKLLKSPGPNQTSPDIQTWLESQGPIEAERLRMLTDKISDAEQQVVQRNRVQTVLLERSRHSVNVLLNSMVNFAATYQPPQSGQTFV